MFFVALCLSSLAWIVGLVVTGWRWSVTGSTHTLLIYVVNTTEGDVQKAEVEGSTRDVETLSRGNRCSTATRRTMA